jgi:hypothetical protein
MCQQLDASACQDQWFAINCCEHCSRTILGLTDPEVMTGELGQGLESVIMTEDAVRTEYPTAECLVEIMQPDWSAQPVVLQTHLHVTARVIMLDFDTNLERGRNNMHVRVLTSLFNETAEHSVATVEQVETSPEESVLAAGVSTAILLNAVSPGTYTLRVSAVPLCSHGVCGDECSSTKKVPIPFPPVDASGVTYASKHAALSNRELYFHQATPRIWLAGKGPHPIVRLKVWPPRQEHFFTLKLTIERDHALGTLLDARLVHCPIDNMGVSYLECEIPAGFELRQGNYTMSAKLLGIYWWEEYRVATQITVVDALEQRDDALLWPGTELPVGVRIPDPPRMYVQRDMLRAVTFEVRTGSQALT